MTDGVYVVVSFVCLVMFWVGIYRWLLRRVFPRLSAIRFAFISVFATAGLIALVIAMSSTDKLVCAGAESGIFAQTNDIPLLGSDTAEERERELRKYCSIYLEKCRGVASQYTTRIYEICQAYL